MLLVLADREYPIEDAIQKSTLADLTALKVQSGIGMKSIKDALSALAKFPGREDFLEDEKVMVALSALVWLCRRRAGEKLTIEQACDVPMSDITFKADPVVEVEPDPT